MLTEYHCHILPNLDDGSDSPEMSLEMVEMMHAQGVQRIVATPHFYAHREKSVADYLAKRQQAFDKIKDRLPIQDIRLGAEVAIEHGISEMKDIDQLRIQGTRIILLEFPYRAFEKWMLEEVYNITAEYNLKVMIAHVHRYLEYYSKEEIELLLSSKSILQLNIEAFSGGWKEKKLAKHIIGNYSRLAFGSDAHNISDRKPNWDILQKKVKPEIIAVSDGMLERYSL